ncbi:MAG: O-antigen ligase family protein [Acidipropionibacterium acidipropionici]|nr:O-antigen ligase family protein [Acidipropionibacterium acidipropionici]
MSGGDPASGRRPAPRPRRALLGAASDATAPRWQRLGAAWMIGALPLAALLGSWAGRGPVFAFRILVVALLVLAVIAGRRHRAGVMVVGLAVLWLGIGSADALLGAPGRRWSELVAVALGLAGMWAMVRLRRFDPVTWLARGWAAAVLASIPVAVWEVATSRHLSTYLNGAWIGHPNVYRAPATWLTNPNLYAVLMAVAVPLLGVRSSRETRSWRWVMIVAAVAAGILLVLTSGRSAMAALAVAVAVRLAASRRGRWLLIAVLAGTVVFAAMHRDALALAVHRVTGVILHHSNEGPSSLSVRAALVAIGLALTASHPLWGVGPGGYETLVRAGGLGWHTHGKVNPHLGVLEISSQYGLLVTAAVAALGVWSVVRVIRGRAEGGSRWWVIGYLCALPVLSLANSTYLVQSVTQLQWMLVAALVCATAARVPSWSRHPVRRGC